MKKPFYFVLFVLLIASLACNFSSILPSTGGGTNSNVLFQDDFSNSSSGWDTVRDAEGVTDYENGGYRIYINKTTYSFWSNPGLGSSLPGDLRIEVDATKTAGPDVNDFGVVCRYTLSNEKANFYQFVVTSDGYVGIVKVTQSDQQVITKGEKLIESSAVNKGNASNKIRAECIGSTLTLYVNGSQVDSVTDTSFTSGDVGLIAGTYEEAGTDVLFDNFVVTKP
jgi:hypothetical protein